MYFTWFNLMPWPYLAEDFRAHHRSIWVDIPSALYDPKKGHIDEAGHMVPYEQPEMFVSVVGGFLG